MRFPNGAEHRSGTGCLHEPDMVQIERATAADAQEILALQRAAYSSEAALYDEPRLPPMVQGIDDLRQEISTALCLKAVTDGRIVGSVRARVEGEICHLGRLIVAPDLQGSGIGTLLMGEIEAATGGDCAQFEVFTGHLSTRNLALYRRLGYHETARERVSDRVELVYLRKDAPAA
jgi:predicted N-acetyltransferase YhbS